MPSSALKIASLACAGLCAAVVTAAQPPSPSAPAPIAVPSRPGAWAVQRTYSGGFRGVLNASEIVASDGSARKLEGAAGDAPPCARLTPPQLEALDRAIAASKPETWRPSYVPAGDSGCCDRYRYTFTLRRRTSDLTLQTFATGWYTGNERQFPADLAAIVHELDTVLRSMPRLCQ
jgi:hypothetical protein